MPKKIFKTPPYERNSYFALHSSAEQFLNWSITEFDVAQTWNFTKGEDIKIAVLDTGVDFTHPDLAENVLDGYNVISPNNPPEDDQEHGSHCAGIIAAVDNDIGVVGVAPKAKIIPIKVLNQHGSGTIEDITTGLNWAVDNGADIISMSFGGNQKDSNFLNAIQNAANNNIPMFCAAGNDGISKKVEVPARLRQTVAVGSIDASLKRSRFSNTGKQLDFMAPGRNIKSTVPGGYAVFSGTSMATPFLAGVTALIMSFARSKNISITNWQNFLKDFTISTEDKPAKTTNFYIGKGIVDLRLLNTWFEQNN